MGYTLTELEALKEKYKYQSPEAQEATEKTFRLADQRLEYALRILGAAHWWLGWRGALMGKAILTTDPAISTACVGFNPAHSRMDYYFNVWFAASLSAGDIAFVIAHECLHLILGHVDQINLFKIEYPQIWNIVTDAFINELLKRTLKWSSGMRSDEKQDWTLQNGIYWKDLPKAVRDKFPVDAGKEGDVNIEYTCIELYEAMVEDMESKGIDPNEFEKAIDQKHFGAEKKRKKKIEREEESSENVVRQKVYVEPGDVVFVKTRETYGLIEKLRRVADQEGEADIFYSDDITKPEWVWLSRAIGVTTKLGKKSFPLSRKIVETYAKMKAAGMRPMTWEPFAQAVGIPEIANLDEIDRLIKERDAADEAEIAAEREELERKLAADAAREAEQEDEVPPDYRALARELASEPGEEEATLGTPESPSALSPSTSAPPEAVPATGQTPLTPQIVTLQSITAQKGFLPFKPSSPNFKRQVALLAAKSMEDFTFGPNELFKTPQFLKAHVAWMLQQQSKR